MSSGRPEFLLLDIEGTTTPLDFVQKVLFPYAKDHVEDFLRRQSGSKEVRADLERLGQEHGDDVRGSQGPPPIQESAQEESWRSPLGYFRWLMDRDRKSTALKSIQGKIWEEGYRLGRLKSRVFPDVPPAFKRWTQSGRRIYIYSSGSVLAQRLLFEHTEAGDLTGYISGHFDTTVGPKVEAESYRKIARELDRSTDEILFVSDAPKELGAASAAGVRAVLCIRPGNPPLPASATHPVVETFEGWP
jgi:enolase-phosphatase E1